ncbi:MAG: 50S ribosomal protein L32 [Nitrospirota bacterium]
MPNPKHKISKSRGGMRRSHKKLTMPGYVQCPECRESKLSHHVCPNCGTYKGREVITVVQK